jgi:hypothetical protein
MLSSFRCILTRFTWLSHTKVITIGKQQGSVSFSRKLETNLNSEWDRNYIWTEVREWFGQKWIMAKDPFGLGLNSSSNILVQFCPFRIESVLSERISLKLLLTSNDAHLGITHYTKVVNNFDTFPARIYTHSSDRWSRTNDLWNSGDAAEIHFCT